MFFQLMFLKVGINFVSAELLEHCLCRSPSSSLSATPNRAVEKEEEKRERGKSVYLMSPYAREIYPAKRR